MATSSAGETPALTSVLETAYEAHSQFTTSTAWEGSPGNTPRSIAPHCRGCGERIGSLEGYSEFHRTLVAGKGGYSEGPRRQGLSAEGLAWQRAHIVKKQAEAVEAFLAGES